MGKINKLHELVKPQFEAASLRCTQEIVAGLRGLSPGDLECEAVLFDLVFGAIMRNANYGDVASPPTDTTGMFHDAGFVAAMK